MYCGSRTKIKVEEKEKLEDDPIANFLNSSANIYIEEVIKYIHYCSFSFFGLFQLVSVMLYINICCFVQGYADHLADCVPSILLSSDKSSEKRDWASYIDFDAFDVRYVASMHQFVIE